MNSTVRTYLIERARMRTNQLVTYQNLSNDCHLGLVMQEGPHIRREIGEILGDISKYEHEHGRPLLSALVIRAGDNYEGDGFYKLAEYLGFGDWQKLKREGVFEVQQMNECIRFWSDPINYQKYR